MVTILVTGTPRETGTMIEVITENLEAKVCSQMPKYPLEVSAAAGSNWKDGKLAICGGSDLSIRLSKCYLLENGEWNEIESLQTVKNGQGASNIGGKIWLTGGYSNGFSAATDIIHPNGTVTQGPELPKGRFGHCQVSYEQSTYILGKCTLCQKL